MSISNKIHKAIWGRSASRCAFPSCRKLLSEEYDGALNPTLVGEVCHISAARPGGERYDPAITNEERNSFNNLILLCRNHHKEIDDPENGERLFPCSTLLAMKTEHEEWVRSRLDFDPVAQKEDEEVAQLIDGWESRCDANNWLAWTSWLLGGGGPMLSSEMRSQLRDLRPWLLSRIWPARHPRIESAMRNFNNVLEAMYTEFSRYAEPAGDMFSTQTFYKKTLVSEEKYWELLRQYEDQVDLVQDLTLELTRSANLVVDRVRETLLPGYRFNEGYFLMQSGMHSDLSFRTFLTRYSPKQAEQDYPFQGTESFIREIESRDRHFTDPAHLERMIQRL